MSKFDRWGRHILGGLLLAWSVMTSANDEIPRLIVVGDQRAVLQLGGDTFSLRVGESKDGVKLLAVSNEGAKIRYQKETLELTWEALNNEAPSSTDTAQSVTLYQEGEFYYANAVVLGRKVRFLVDTGASHVVFNSLLADKLGIPYKRGKRGFATTASGYTEVYNLRINEVAIQGLSVFNVRVSVIEGRFPTLPLLGNSFLNAVEITQQGNSMTLRKRQ